TQIVSYLRDAAIEYCTDETNADLHPTRNRIRHVLLPLMERDFNPEIRTALVRAAQQIGAADDYITRLARESIERTSHSSGKTLLIDWLARLPKALGFAVVREWVRLQGH